MVLVILSSVLVAAGYLLPLPAAILAWRGWPRERHSPTMVKWQRSATQVGLLFLSAGILVWSYAVVQLVRDHYSYIAPSAVVGRWGSCALFLISMASGPNLRGFLIPGALGLPDFLLDHYRRRGHLAVFILSAAPDTAIALRLIELISGKGNYADLRIHLRRVRNAFRENCD
jgi:hypothetical protein